MIPAISRAGDLIRLDYDDGMRGAVAITRKQAMALSCAIYQQLKLSSVSVLLPVTDELNFSFTSKPAAAREFIVKLQQTVEEMRVHNPED